MKTFNLCTLLSVIAVVSAFSINAQQYRFIANDNSFASKICVLVGSNDIAKLKLTFRRYDLNKHHIANDYKCNELALSKFAFKYNADQTFKYINRYSHYDNKVTPSVTISDVAMNTLTHQQEPIIVYIN
ncbi:DUF3718 domain-containing protein [Thalassotalea sp. G2M2-11]|uniref:DUF3718 domain-containing protein n=1 Tax=Thalassotalea sp. G2M2-11 TaxID=2787627 RepID=UPI0019D0999C|nr:DUF3718 domain-containing protein [Thalassotalea sp. G2M2-11]